jgi:serine/threonine-protein kinase
MQTQVSTHHVVQPMVVGRDPDVLPAGAKAGPWIVGAPLGRGGMGTVYAVVHDDIGKRAALKVMHRRLCAGPALERTLLEARVVNRVGHPNIVDIFETGTLDDGRPYIVMERLDGISLNTRAFQTKLQPDRVIEILLQVCDALVAAHAAGVIHRDLKLENVFLIDNPDEPARPRVKILDWGIAKEVENDVSRTVDGLLVGTPQYVSPEQARGDHLTPATDVYSLGVMAYELFLEQLPFEADTSAEIMTMHLRATPPPPSDVWPDIPVGLEQLLLAMLAKHPDRRPTMLTVAHALELVRDELDRRRGLAPPVVKTPTRRYSTAPSIDAPARWHAGAARWQVAVGALALVASVGGFVLTRDGDSMAATIETPPAARAIAPPARAPMPVVVAAPVPVVAMPAPVVHAVTRRAAAMPVVETPPRGHHTSSRPKTAPARAAPRPSSAIDPDGSVEAY